MEGVSFLRSFNKTFKCKVNEVDPGCMHEERRSRMRWIERKGRAKGGGERKRKEVEQQTKAVDPEEYII